MKTAEQYGVPAEDMITFKRKSPNTVPVIGESVPAAVFPS